MIAPFDSISGITISTDAANLALDSTTFKQGAGSIRIDKSGTSANSANINIPLAVPIDFYELRQRKDNLSFWVNHADFTDISYVGLNFYYNSALTLADVYRISSFSAGWNKSTTAIGSPLLIGTPTDADRQRGAILLLVNIVVTSAAVTFTNLRVDAAYLDGALAYSMLDFGARRRLSFSRPFTPWRRQMEAVSVINPAEQAVETVFETSSEHVHAGMSALRSFAYREGARRWLQYATRNNDWSMAKDARNTVNTTVDAASGFSSANSRVLNIASTADIEFLITDLGMECWLAVLSKAGRQVEVAKVESVSSGVSVTLASALANDYVSGDIVVSADAQGKVAHFPSAALLDANALHETDAEVLLDIKARWAA